MSWAARAKRELRQGEFINNWYSSCCETKFHKFLTSQLLEERKLRVLVSFLPDTDHFNLTERLADKDYEITREIVEVAKGKA